MRIQGAAEFGTCLKDCIPEKSTWGTKAGLVSIHLVIVGGLFLLDIDMIDDTIIHPWYTALYVLLCVLTLFQYFLTSLTPPGYVIDVLNSQSGETDMKGARDSISCPASGKETLVTIHAEGPSHATTSYGAPSGSRAKADVNPSIPSANRNSNCAYCHVWQPPRSKHCHDCEKCVLRFDHHCVWLGTCVGKGNHCRFWWYLFEETILCVWTAVIYVMSINKEISKTWWRGGLEIILLIVLLFCLIIVLMLLIFHSYLVLTNQTTYELIRRRRIHYLRGIPNNVHPFSKGVLRNIYFFCWSRDDFFALESLPTREELEAKARPYTFHDILTCRCC